MAVGTSRQRRSTGLTESHSLHKTAGTRQAVIPDNRPPDRRNFAGTRGVLFELPTWGLPDLHFVTIVFSISSRWLGGLDSTDPESSRFFCISRFSSFFAFSPPDLVLPPWISPDRSEFGFFALVLTKILVLHAKSHSGLTWVVSWN